MEVGNNLDPADICSVDVFLEFFEVCIHTILFARKVYPTSIFALKKKYNVPVHISVHPDLNQYISNVLKSVKKFLISNQLKQLAIGILDATSKPVEKFVFNNFNVSSLIFENESDVLSELQESFRAFCLKLSTSDFVLKPVPDNSSFKIYIKTEEAAFMNTFEDPTFEGFPWIAEDNISKTGSGDIYPLHTLHTSSFHIEMYVEI